MIGFVVGGVASGVGKTTLTVGLIAALLRRGLTVQPFKVGPDYIDPSHHSQMAGRPSRNLDSWLIPEPALRDLYARASTGADAVVVEGVMGLFDGKSDRGEAGSTAHVARLLDLPVVLVVDAAKAARSAAAVVLGFKTLDPRIRIVGVVLNHVGSDAHYAAAAGPIEQEVGVPVLGHVPRDEALRLQERYLGLVPAAERRLSPSYLSHLADVVERGIDVERLLMLAEIVRPVAPASGLIPAARVATRCRIAVARDDAFSFYYEDNLDLLRAHGADLAEFSPLSDPSLPADCDGLYLGGGFPELFASRLAANTSLLHSIHSAADSGMPIYAECGGLMYLGEGLVDREGVRHAMVGIVAGWSTMTKPRLTLGYREVRARRDSPLLRADDLVRGHEFHWSTSDAPPSHDAAYYVLGTADRLEGSARGSVLASYMHLHFASDARLAPRLVDACAAWRSSSARGPLKPRSIGTVTACADAARNDADAQAAGYAPGGLTSVPEERLERALASPVQSATTGPLLRRFGLAPECIERLSLDRILERDGHRLPADEPTRSLVARLVYAVGDLDLAERVVVGSGAIEAAVRALANGAPLVVDVGMVAAGVSRPLLRRPGTRLVVALDVPGAAERARRDGITRTAAGILALGPDLDGAIVAIGNAPTALLALLDLVGAGIARPAAVIGVPVGFVAAEESKEALLATDLPLITIRGSRGGSPLAAAASNHLLRRAVAELEAATVRHNPAIPSM
ncbi:MAG: cobyrinate a,c-diamide synthase [Chloroflexi bacterium]|nr:cobyrinate a,c-diamide synthase [Chloroflexota bacterium]